MTVRKNRIIATLSGKAKDGIALGLSHAADGSIFLGALSIVRGNSDNNNPPRWQDLNHLEFQPQTNRGHRIRHNQQ